MKYYLNEMDERFFNTYGVEEFKTDLSDGIEKRFERVSELYTALTRVEENRYSCYGDRRLQFLAYARNCYERYKLHSTGKAACIPTFNLLRKEVERHEEIVKEIRNELFNDRFTNEPRFVGYVVSPNQCFGEKWGNLLKEEFPVETPLEALCFCPVVKEIATGRTFIYEWRYDKSHTTGVREITEEEAIKFFKEECGMPPSFCNFNIIIK